MPNADPQPSHDHETTHDHHSHPARSLSVLAWPAWRRVLVVLPLVLALWLAVAWANMGATPW